MSNYQTITSDYNYVLSSSPTSSDTGYKFDPYSGAGMVVQPDGSSVFVRDKIAYFAEHPAARVSTEASVRDLRAWCEEHDAKVEREERARAEKMTEDENELSEAMHECTGSKLPSTCGGCGGNGCARGRAKSGDKCKNCAGKGFVFAACDRCEQEKQAKEKGDWNKPRKGPGCAGEK